MPAAPDRYAVMGNPIAHSLSPRIHLAFARQTSQNLIYEAILVEPQGFPEAVDDFCAGGGKGLNITLPFKHEAWECVVDRSDRAERAGAVNTILCRPDGTRHGDNTDGVGLVRDVLDNLQGSIKGKRILLLGAGGAVCGTVGSLLKEEPAQLVIANRTVDRAVALADRCSPLGNVEGCGFEDLDGWHFDLIINGTSASLQGDVPPLPETVLKAGGWCYDMAYNREGPTAFVLWGAEHGAAQTVDGLGMLVEQAAESFVLWRGVRPQTGAVIAALRAGDA
jgi:shikimate dehydrogenase